MLTYDEFKQAIDDGYITADTVAILAIFLKKILLKNSREFAHQLYHN
ncbi:phage protein [Streptococcus pyogenes]|nr:phage protein [Streptococcus pyogenes]